MCLAGLLLLMHHGAVPGEGRAKRKEALPERGINAAVALTRSEPPAILAADVGFPAECGRLWVRALTVACGQEETFSSVSRSVIYQIARVTSGPF